jgi:ABC-type branched-subunit amino acid transport system substrate-binding protein
MLDALERCIALEGKPSRLCVANALAGTTGYEGLTGTISFDKWGQATGREVHLFEIAGGQYPGEFRSCPVCSQ